jgi:hypothetical protein
MSKQNKANRNNYMQAGRLTPDDMARERKAMHQDRVRNQEEDRPRPPRASRGSSPRRTSRGE